TMAHPALRKRRACACGGVEGRSWDTAAEHTAPERRPHAFSSASEVRLLGPVAWAPWGPEGRRVPWVRAGARSSGPAMPGHEEARVPFFGTRAPSSPSPLHQ